MEMLFIMFDFQRKFWEDKESLLCLSLFSDDGGRFLQFNTIQGAINGKEKKESSKKKSST